jgi:hypothetical protein
MHLYELFLLSHLFTLRLYYVLSAPNIATCIYYISVVVELLEHTLVLRFQILLKPLEHCENQPLLANCRLKDPLGVLLGHLTHLFFALLFKSLSLGNVVL